MIVPIRRIMKIAPVCKEYAIMENFLVDMFFIEAINVTPISVGRGEAMRKPAKDANRYFRIESGTFFRAY